MNSKIISFLKFILGWPLAIVAIIFISRFIYLSSKEVLNSISNVDYVLVFLSICCFLAYFFFRAIVWKMIFKHKGHHLSLVDTCYLWSSSEIKRFLPGGVWAILGRTQAFAKKDVKHKTVISTILIEVEAIFIGSLIISFLGINFLQSLPFEQAIKFVSVFLTIVVIVVFAFGKALTKNLPKLTHHILPTFSIKQNLEIIFFAVISMLFFSMGTYFSIISIFNLQFDKILMFLGLFSFSLLAGYMLVFIPMGLGIREGIITFGLSKFVSSGLAATGAIFARIIVVIAELIFFFLCSILYHTKK